LAIELSSLGKLIGHIPFLIVAIMVADNVILEANVGYNLLMIHAWTSGNLIHENNNPVLCLVES
jgi:hypothetical protein